MKRIYLKALSLTVGLTAIAAATASFAQVTTTTPGGGIRPVPPGGGLQPAPAASFPSLKRADLTAASAGAQFGFVIRNGGTGDAVPSTTTIKCTAYTSNTPGQGTYVPCVQGTHYTSTPQMPPPGTVSSGDTWKVPTPAIAATSGQFAFTLGVKTTTAQRTRGLNFQVCADSHNAVNESNEGNNCYGFNYTWPN
jgi:CARDB